MGGQLRQADYLLMLVAWISISVSSILVLLSEASSLQAAFWRVLLGSLLTMAAARRVIINPLARPLHAASGLLLGVHFLTWMESLFHVPVAVSTTLVVLYPLFLLVFDTLVLKEPLGKAHVMGMIIAFVGVLIMMAPGLQQPDTREWLVGSLLALAGALAASGYFALGRIARKNGTPLEDYTSSVYLWAAFSLYIYSLTAGSTLIPKASSWPYLIALATVPMLGGHSVMNYLLKKTSSSTVTSIALGEPAGATLLAWLLLQQTPTPTTLAGMLVTLIGLVMATKASPKK